MADRRAALEGMTDALAHRGPDGAGSWLDERVALGHRRLAIIDLSAGGAQPMAGDSGAVITFNGEIYNYRELRAGLEAKGERFRTDSDTEVLLKLWEAEGTACVDKLVGMFAFAVWEPRHGRIVLVRDRLGKKPLYYSEAAGRLAFASELKGLLALNEVARRAAIDPLAISDFLSLGYILTPKTILTNVRRLPAGHLAVFDVAAGALTIREYWRIDDHFNAAREPHDAAARESFAERFADAVKLRLRSDVPLGVYLSGGLDSSAVAAVMAQGDRSGTRAFCVGFPDRSFDESPHARVVADHLGIGLEVLQNPDPDPALVSRVVWHCDEPFSDTSLLPTFLLNSAARRHVTVALSGDGGDEILAGYPTYRADAYHRVVRRMPRPFMQGLSRMATHLLKPRYRKVSLDYKVRQFLGAHGMDAERAHYWWRVVFPEGDKHRLMSPDLAKACAGYDPFESFADAFRRVPKADFLDRTLYVDIKTWLQDDILVKADRMSMANSLEVRSPFLDHRLVEAMARLAPSAKMHGKEQKVLLKEALGPSLPPAIVRRRKSGFNAPTRSLGCVTLDDRAETGLFNPAFTLDPQREDITYKSFSLATLGAWLRLFGAFRNTGKWEP